MDATYERVNRKRKTCDQGTQLIDCHQADRCRFEARTEVVRQEILPDRVRQYQSVLQLAFRRHPLAANRVSTLPPRPSEPCLSAGSTPKMPYYWYAIGSRTTT